MSTSLSHWTKSLLLDHGKLVKTFTFQLEDLTLINGVEVQLLDLERSAHNNTTVPKTLADLQDLCKLRLDSVTCEDQTWNMNSWPQWLTHLELSRCCGLTAGMVHKILSGSAPCLTRLELDLHHPQDKPDIDSQTDLPALKQLFLECDSGFSIASFKGCKGIECIQYPCIVTNALWDLMKPLLFTYTWPKLSFLNLRHTTMIIDHENLQIPTKKEVDEIWDSLNIKLLINVKKDLLGLVQQSYPMDHPQYLGDILSNTLYVG
ncbi:uncharacterized protein MELLADRAFT_103989 [Melampsora larici-populina 98AG31]|uniref:F-box domain-containing protein n=1 Tax=Melampsora larici-populina (strain 98AG31 / pathotype 3-4-7) TaxID=747676 RepID=F4RCC2_MELLP|nr:uncharacterized protein MELLADRAFT_103989 [Melampsora larici-populina 98AG31]EGG09858.1 hypothetical protein MELLADRAFT_103989 [Melampsora larici-populina 98AG31]